MTDADNLAKLLEDYLAGNVTLAGLGIMLKAYRERDKPKPFGVFYPKAPVNPGQPFKVAEHIQNAVQDGQAMKAECPEFTLYGVCEDRGELGGKWFVPLRREDKPGASTVAPNPDPLDLKDWQTVPLIGHLPPGDYEAQGEADDKGRFVIRRIRAKRKVEDVTREGEPLMAPQRQVNLYGRQMDPSTAELKGSFPNREHLQVGPRIGGLPYVRNADGRSVTPKSDLRADLDRIAAAGKEPICRSPFGTERCLDCRCDVDYWERDGGFFWPCQKDGRSSQTTEKLPATKPTNGGA